MSHLANPLLTLLLGGGHEAKLRETWRKDVERELVTLVPLLLDLDHFTVVQNLMVGGRGRVRRRAEGEMFVP